MRLALLLVLLTATLAGATGTLTPDANAVKVQGFAPNGLYSAVLTANSVSYDMTGFIAWSVYSPADCKVRIKDSAAKGVHIQEPILGGQWTTIVVNPATKFVDYSGCTGGFLRRM